MSQKKNSTKPSLKIQVGIEQPPQLNESAIKKLKGTVVPDGDALFKGIIAGDRAMLGKAITLIESSLPAHHKVAQKLIERCLPLSGKSIRIGITGVPGVGKSTFIDSFGSMLIRKGRRLAVLAVDPSSSRSKGSILGDKTRMEELGANSSVFIRPSPTGGTLGGVARKTWETIILCEAAGFNIVFVETVGVGQSEVAVHSMVDFFLLLMLAGAGDELQGIKRGIMELADAIVINKADGDNVKRAKAARAEYNSAVKLFPPTDSGWEPPVLICSSTEKSGLSEVWKTIEEFISYTRMGGWFEKKRAEQAKFRMFQCVKDALHEDFYKQKKIMQNIPEILKLLDSNSISAYEAAKRLLALNRNK